MRIPIIDFHTMDTGELKNAHLYVNKTMPFVMHVKIIYLVLTKQRKENRDICAPVSQTDPERIKLTLQGQRLRCAELERELNEMQSELLKSNVEVDQELSDDFTQILDSADSRITPFTNLFWQEQKKLFSKSPTGVRYHPMILGLVWLTLLPLVSLLPS